MKRALGLLLFACGPVSQEEARIERSEHAIIGGEPSAAADDAVVIVARYSIQGAYYQCFGAVIAPRLVLTARHCVEGRPPSALHVYPGRDAWSKLREGASAARGERVFDTPGFDAAVVLLDRAVSAPVAPIRLDGAVREGERVAAVGFGVAADGASPQVRHRRSGLAVIAVGPVTTRIGEDVLAGEFVIGEAACSGDSGGPALSGSGAVVGLASRVGNGVDDPNGAAFCLGSDAHDVYVGTAAIAPMLRAAFDAAGAAPAAETMSAAIDVSPEPQEHGGCR
jgi:secreted trypsin-like serine protease